MIITKEIPRGIGYVCLTLGLTGEGFLLLIPKLWHVIQCTYKARRECEELPS